MPHDSSTYDRKEIQRIATSTSTTQGHITNIINGYSKTSSRHIAEIVSALTGETPIMYLIDKEKPYTSSTKIMEEEDTPTFEPTKSVERTVDIVGHILSSTSKDLKELSRDNKAALICFLESQLAQSYKAGLFLLREIDRKIAALNILKGESCGSSSTVSAVPQVPKSLEQAEHDAIYSTLESMNWNRTRTAKKLGVTVRTIRTKVAEMKKKGYKIKENQSAYQERNEWLGKGG